MILTAQKGKHLGLLIPAEQVVPGTLVLPQGAQVFFCFCVFLFSNKQFPSIKENEKIAVKIIWAWNNNNV